MDAVCWAISSPDTTIPPCRLVSAYYVLNTQTVNTLGPYWLWLGWSHTRTILTILRGGDHTPDHIHYSAWLCHKPGPIHYCWRGHERKTAHTLGPYWLWWGFVKYQDHLIPKSLMRPFWLYRCIFVWLKLFYQTLHLIIFRYSTYPKLIIDWKSWM